MNPRTIAGTARGTVIVGAGLALGALSAHFYGDAVATAAEPVTQAGPVKPKVVTIVRKKHVKSDPIIVYRKVPVYDSAPATGGSTGGSWSSGGSSSGGYSSGGSSGGTTTHVAPAPAPAPAPAKPPAATSGAS
ncbi:MAG: hypothetical protein U0R64_00240 [Candidatus Nanopelagicales bacterium]